MKAFFDEVRTGDGFEAVSQQPQSQRRLNGNTHPIDVKIGFVIVVDGKKSGRG
jgi:hypothetical protein